MHERKNCPRCGKGFECNPCNISQCQCFDVNLNIEQKAFLEERYQDCLCKECLLKLGDVVEMFKERFIYR